MDEKSPYGPGPGVPADRPRGAPPAEPRPARSRALFWWLVVLGLLVVPVVLAFVWLVNGFTLWDGEPANAGAASAALVAIPVVYGITCVFLLGAAIQRGGEGENVVAECVTLGLAVGVPVAGYFMLFPPPPEEDPVVDSGTSYAASYGTTITGSLTWEPGFLAAVGAAEDRDALVAAVEEYEYPGAAGDSVSYTYDIDVTAFEGTGRSPLPGRGVVRVTVAVEAGTYDDGGTTGQWSAGEATTCSTFRVSAADGVHDIQPVDCADADVVPPLPEPTPQEQEPEPSATSWTPRPTDPDEIHLLDLLGSLGPDASEDDVARVVGEGFPRSPVQTDRSDDEIVVVVGAWEECLVGVLPEDGAPFRFSSFDRILLNRGEMGCSPQLYLNPVTTH